MSVLLQVKGISKRFPRAHRPALDKVSFDVEDQELLTLVGASGSGKTSLLRILAGLETPDQGEVILSGERLTGAQGIIVPPERRQMGFVFQNHALFPHLTVMENVGFGLERQEHGAQHATELLGLVGLGGMAARYPHELSGGERQRIALVRALAPGPRLVLMDEPFSSLDQALRLELRDETRRLVKQRGATSILVMHDTGDALAVSDRIVVLREGVVQQIGSPQEIYRQPANRYIASSFGPCNFLNRKSLADPQASWRGIQPADVASEELWVRPEDLSLVTEEPGLRLATGVVTENLFHGESRMVTLDCRSADGAAFELLVRQHGEERAHVGERWDIAPAGNGSL